MTPLLEKVALLLILGMVPAVVQASPVEVTSAKLKELLETRNAKVAALKLDADAAQEREGALLRSFLPSIEVSTAQESFKKGQGDQKSQPAYGVEAKMNLFNGGRDSLREDIRSLDSQKKAIAIRRGLAEELDKARPVYWNALYLRDKILLLREMIEVNKSSLASALRRIKNGVATDSDRFEFEMKTVDLLRELKDAELKFKSESRLLILLLGLPAQSELQLNEKWTHDHDLDALIKHRSADHEFLLQENELQADQMKLMATEAGRAWWPRVDAYAGYNQFNQRIEEFPDAQDRRESVVGIRLSASLPAGFEASRESAALRKEAQAQRLKSDFLRQEVENHLSAEFEELKSLHDQVHDADENIERAGRYNKLTQSEYLRGVKNSPDVLGASEKLYGMKNKRLEIMRDFQIAKSHLLSKMGK